MSSRLIHPQKVSLLKSKSRKRKGKTLVGISENISSDDEQQLGSTTSPAKRELPRIELKSVIKQVEKYGLANEILTQNDEMPRFAIDS
jgi:hypothetical protein